MNKLHLDPFILHGKPIDLVTNFLMLGRYKNAPRTYLQLLTVFYLHTNHRVSYLNEQLYLLHY